MIGQALNFYVFFAGLVVFLFRKEAVYFLTFCKTVFFVRPLLIVFLAIMNSEIILELISIQGSNIHMPFGEGGFRFINFLFYIMALQIGFMVVKSGWGNYTVSLHNRVIFPFLLFSMVCLLSALFAQQVDGTPWDWNIQHGIRLIVFFLFVHTLTLKSKSALPQLKLVFYGLTVLLFIPTALNVFSGINYELMPLNLYDISVKGLIDYQKLIGQANYFSLQINSQAWIFAILALISINMTITNGKVMLRYLIPLLPSLIVLFQVRSSQTAYITFLVGLVLITIAKLRWWSVVFVAFLGTIVIKWRSFFLELFNNGQSIVSVFQQNERLTKLFPIALEGIGNKLWFGHGYISGEALAPKLNAIWEHVEIHNSFLSIAFNTGLLGLSLFVYGLVKVTLLVFQYWIKSKFNLFSTNLILTYIATVISSLTYTDVWYKFDDYLLIRMYPFFIILLASQMINDSNTQKCVRKLRN